MKVEIDGVLYVPVADSSPDAESLMRATALQYMTPGLLAEYGHAGLFVSVNEDGHGEPLEVFVARLVQERESSETS